MKFRQPLVLLLGSVLSASGLGCSAITSLVGDSRPAARQGRDSSERLVAIAQVFEHQGRYDQAEVMYRKALKADPSNAAVRGQLKQLAERKNDKIFKADPSKTAVARNSGNGSTPLAKSHPAISSNSSTRPSSPSRVVATEKPTAKSDEQKGIETTIADASTVRAMRTAATRLPDTDPQPGQAVDSSAITFASVSREPSGATEVTQVSAEAQTTVVAAPAVPPETHKPFTKVTSDEVLAVVESPADNAELLLDGLRYGDSLETQCLAATLLGDCSPENEAIQKALQKANSAAVDPQLRLAICNSRIQRMEQDAITADCLIQVVTTASADLRIQACSDMRHFAGSQWEDNCITVLQDTLESDLPKLRAGAAVTLGDFPRLHSSTVERLQELSRSDSSLAVREAATTALMRHVSRSSGFIADE
jgi:tetratricopeptide (TPR) repeat protein